MDPQGLNAERYDCSERIRRGPELYCEGHPDRKPGIWEGSIYGNPWLRILRSQLEQYITKELGAAYLSDMKNRTELRKIKKQITDLKKRLDVLQARKAEIEQGMGK
jgi:hypothetical protein